MPDVSCHCNDCEGFRLPHNNLLGLFEKVKTRDTDVVSDGVADLLWNAWLGTREAWARHQQYPKHGFVQKSCENNKNKDFYERRQRQTHGQHVSTLPQSMLPTQLTCLSRTIRSRILGTAGKATINDHSKPVSELAPNLVVAFAIPRTRFYGP